MQRKGLGLLAAAAAAYGYYKYSRMSAAQKTELKNKAKGFMDKGLSGINNLFGKKTATQTATAANGY